MLFLLTLLSVSFAPPGRVTVQEVQALDARDYRDRPDEGMEVADELIARAVEADAGAVELVNLRYQAARIARYGAAHERAIDWLRASIADPRPLFRESDGHRIYWDSVSSLRHALFALDRSEEARAVADAALQQIAESSVLTDRDRAVLAGNIRLYASDRGNATRDFAASLAWLTPIFEDSELLLGDVTSASVIAWAARQRSLYQFELGDRDAAFRGLDEASEQLGRAKLALGDERFGLLALLCTRELMLADQSGSVEQIAGSIQKAERLVGQLEGIRGDGRPEALRSACNLVRMIVQALGDEEVERKIAALDRVLKWCATEPALLDPGFRALPFTVDIARNIYDSVGHEDLDHAADLQRRITRLFDEAQKQFGEESVGALRKDLEECRYSYDRRVTQRDLIGRAAPELATEAIVHEGEVDRRGLDWEDLRGNVVLIEFWNVHCGPCIQGFPELAALEREHGDRGFLVLGQTSFHGMRWDDGAKQAVRDSEATRAEELDMFLQFAEHHRSKHRYVVTADRDVDRRYGILANPTGFLVDRGGRVRMVVSSAEFGTRGFHDMIETLLNEK